MKMKLVDRKGFSLAEAMITVFIFSLMIGGLYSILYVGQESWEANKVKIELQQSLRRGMEWMKYDLYQAGQSSISNVPADGNLYTTITFKIPTGVTGGVITWDTNSIQFVLGGTNNEDLQRIYGGVTKVLASSMSSLQFRRQAASPDILEVKMAAQKQTVQDKTINYQLDFQVELRN